MAGSACLGYAVAGLLELRAPGYRSIAVQNLAAIAFNAFAAVASWLAAGVRDRAGSSPRSWPWPPRSSPSPWAGSPSATADERPLERPPGVELAAHPGDPPVEVRPLTRAGARVLVPRTSRALFQPSWASAPMSARPSARGSWRAPSSSMKSSITSSRVASIRVAPTMRYQAKSSARRTGHAAAAPVDDDDPLVAQAEVGEAVVAMDEGPRRPVERRAANPSGSAWIARDRVGDVRGHRLRRSAPSPGRRGPGSGFGEPASATAIAGDRNR